MRRIGIAGGARSVEAVTASSSGAVATNSTTSGTPRGVGERVQHPAGDDVGPTGCKRSFNEVTAEVPPHRRAAPTAARGSLGACGHAFAVGGHHLCRNEVVAGRAVLARDPGLSKCLGLVRWVELDAREDLLCSLRPGRHGHRLIVGSRSAQQVATTLPIAGVVAL